MNKLILIDNIFENVLSCEDFDLS